MSIGEHLEELRWRLILGLLGYVVVGAVCLWYGKKVTSWFCAPLTLTLQARHINPQLFYTQVGDPFMVDIHISLIVAAAIASPWMLYQLWQFVAAGLYPHERKYVTKYLPLSIGLLISGMVFVYVLVLPWTLQFFIDWGNDIPLPEQDTHLVDNGPTLPKLITLDGDPAHPQDGDFWFNKEQGKLKTYINGKQSVIQLQPAGLLAPHIAIDDYIDMVVMMLLTFGLSFQLPLVVMAVIRIGIFDIETLKAARKYVYFGLLIVAAAITPGDVITATIALTVPLAALYELGIFLGRPPKEEKAAKA